MYTNMYEKWNENLYTYKFMWLWSCSYVSRNSDFAWNPTCYGHAGVLRNQFRRSVSQSESTYTHSHENLQEQIQF